MLEFYQNSFGWMDDEQKKKVVILSDAYYMDPSRRWLRANYFQAARRFTYVLGFCQSSEVQISMETLGIES